MTEFRVSYREKYNILNIDYDIACFEVNRTWLTYKLWNFIRCGFGTSILTDKFSRDELVAAVEVLSLPKLGKTYRQRVPHETSNPNCKVSIKSPNSLKVLLKLPKTLQP